MIVTINTDASFFHNENVGGYAFWIKSDFGKVSTAGAIKGHCTSALEAELKSIGNAVSFLLTWNIPHITMVVINTDCKCGIDCIEGRQVFRKEHISVPIFHIRTVIEKIKRKHNMPDLLNNGNPSFQFRYVEAHTKGEDKRSFVNNWCDVESRKAARKRIKELSRQ